MRRLLFLVVLPFLVGGCCPMNGRHGTAHERIGGSAASDIPQNWQPAGKGKQIVLERQKPVFVAS